ncbi:acyl-CoA synthetase [Curvivirga aplysinae]|uniref:acyl-CoA synthetase n=1 Tax=Curvivirga aplysinae TaxID=2529852 RepID=UPI0012BB5C69|nr:acyl-CoA synthetase [Curvivirga aplysinae]MTI09368.1 acyl-CoA synthetase [Curvivirga aplysinae]
MGSAVNATEGLEKNPANYVPLSPISFLVRTKDVFPDRTSVIYGDKKYTWAETYERCVRFASALKKAGLKKGEVVSILSPNIPPMFEAHFAVAMAGGVLNTINMRLEHDTLAYIFDHAETKILIVDRQFSLSVKHALNECENKDLKIIDIVDGLAPEVSGEDNKLGDIDYESFVASGDADFNWQMPDDEWDSLALNYTSGTSGRPKGVVYHHRGAYLMAMGTIPGWNMQNHPTYLYVVPMFHCNGWGHAWTMTALAGTIVCLRYVDPGDIYTALSKNKVTHFGGAPIVLSMLINATDEQRKPLHNKVHAMTAGAPPPAAVIEKVQKLGIDITQVYGLTETFGHVLECVWQDQWDGLNFKDQAAIKAQQGVVFPMMEGMRIVNLETGEPVARDGEELGEIQLRGNTVMKGYLKAPEATAEAFKDGWFHSGDLAVMHPSGYAEIRDRLKDIIISGGENISSVEVEGVLFKHPAVSLAAVVARPDEKWGETPCAFIELKEGEDVTEDELIKFCREHLAGFQMPKTILFEDLPKTATGKIQKFKLREKARHL